MTESFLLEYIDRVGLVTPKELAEQLGAGGRLWRKPAVELLQKRNIFLSRFDHGKETLISRHLLFCLCAVYQDPELSPLAQELYDWLSENELVSLDAMFRAVRTDQQSFDEAFLELQQTMVVAPFMIKRELHQAQPAIGELSDYYEFLWVTSDYWMMNLQRAARYKNLEYCLSEIRRLLQNRFSTREIDGLIFQGVL